MGVLRWNANAVKFEIAGGTRVMNHGASVTKIVGRPRRRIYTHMTHSTTDHDFFNTVPVENVF